MYLAASNEFVLVAWICGRVGQLFALGCFFNLPCAYVFGLILLVSCEWISWLIPVLNSSTGIAAQFPRCRRNKAIDFLT